MEGETVAEKDALDTKELIELYEEILVSELIPAQGCTEPIAIALSAARAKEILGACPEQLTVFLAGNMIKNAKSVTVPNSGGKKGIEIAAALGALAGDASQILQVLSAVTPSDVERAVSYVRDGHVTIELVDNEENLYVRTVAKAGEHESYVEIKYDHTRYNSICFDGEMILDRTRESSESKDTSLLSFLSVKNIVLAADQVDFSSHPDLVASLERQIELNQAIADEGLNNPYGAEIGRTLLSLSDDAVSVAKARAAAGSDARMNGSDLPVVINSGSGNQGITVSVPVIEYAKHHRLSKDRLLRALFVSNLLAIHQKRFIGKLSAFCGVVSAAAAAGGAIAYMDGEDLLQVERTIINTLATAGGIVCDGAKASCAAKIALALDNAFLAKRMAERDHVFQPGDGIVGQDVEETIRNVGRMAKDGMRSTDLEILLIMTGK